MSNVIVSEVLEAFSPAFKSVDLRIVAVKQHAQWVNVIASVFMSSKSLEEIKSEQIRIREKLPKTDRFNIFLACYPSGQASVLLEQLEEEVKTHEATIRTSIHGPLRLKVDSFLPSYLKDAKDWKLIGSQADSRKDDSLWHILESQNGSARLIGYENIYELIRETLRIKDFDRGRPRGLVIGIPMPARIIEMSIDGSALKIKTKKVFCLDNLQLNISAERVYPRTSYFETFRRKIHPIKKCKKPSKHEFCYVTNSVQLDDLRPHDRIEVELIHKQVPTLSMDKSHLMVPLGKPFEPFAKVLNAFCSLDLFKERLLTPERFVEGRTKPNTVFENAVAWLLSIIGFSVVQLGRRFENLKIPETGYQVGSIDMIAYKENEYLLLVDCDTSIPDEKKIRSMKTVKDYFKIIQDKKGEPRLLSVIFSPKDCTGIQRDPLNIRIIDSSQIKRIFEEAMMGNTQEAQYSVLHS